MSNKIEKQIDARVSHKIDIEANWDKAKDKFKPYNAEWIIYAPDETHPYYRFKIGDGERYINQLDFINVNNEDISKEIASNLANGEAEFSVIQEGDDSVNNYGSSVAYAISGTAFGDGTVAGSKGFRIISYDVDSRTYTLDIGDYESLEAAGYVVGDIFSIYLKTTLDDFGSIIALNGNVVTVDNFVKLPSGSEPGTANGDSYLASSYFRVATKPTIGIKYLGTGAHTIGLKTKALATAAYSEGYNNISNGKYSHTDGRDNKANYAARSSGQNNKSLGYRSSTDGRYNVAMDNSTHADGYENSAGMGWRKLSSVDTVNNQFTLYNISRIEVNDVYSIYERSISNHGEFKMVPNIGKIIAIDPTTNNITVDTMFSTRDNKEYYLAIFKKPDLVPYAESDAYTLITNSLTTGMAAHVEGYHSVAAEKYSHAQNWSTVASGVASSAGGRGTVATEEAQTAIGKYNEIDSNALFIVGNGESDTSRSNAFTVNKDGTASIAKDPSKDNNVANKKYVDTKNAESLTKINEFNDKLNNYANSIIESKNGSLLVLDDISPNITDVTITGEPNTKVYVTSSNLAKYSSMLSKGTTDWRSNNVAIYPPKNRKYTFSCDFTRKSGSIVGIAVKPDAKTLGSSFEPTSTETSGKLSVTVDIGDYNDAVYLFVYSNYSSTAMESECEFSNMIFSPIDLYSEDNNVRVSKTYTTDEETGELTIPVPDVDKVLIYTLDGTELSATYSRDTNKSFEEIDEVTAKRLTEIDKANWVEDAVPQEWIDKEISADNFPYKAEGVTLQKSKDSGYAYDFGRAYNRIYAERSGDGWGGHGGGQYAKYALTLNPYKVPDPDYKDWDIIKDENGNIVSMAPKSFNDSIPLRRNNGHIRVPKDVSAYENTGETSDAIKMYATSKNYVDTKDAEIKSYADTAANSAKTYTDEQIRAKAYGNLNAKYYTTNIVYYNKSKDTTSPTQLGLFHSVTDSNIKEENIPLRTRDGVITCNVVNGASDKQAVNKKYVDDKIGAIENILDNILLAQENIIGG